jgi:hypothetical protein
MTALSFENLLNHITVMSCLFFYVLFVMCSVVVSFVVLLFCLLPFAELFCQFSSQFLISSLDFLRRL